MVYIGRSAERLGRVLTVVIVALSLAVIGKPALANPLNLTLQTFPDIMSDLIDVRYDAASQTLTAHGYAEHITNSSSETQPISNGTFEIVASIANTGSLKSGSLTIRGEIPALGIPQGTLLTGNLNNLGVGEAEGPIELQFETSGGSLSENYGPVISVILSQTGFGGTFTQDFSSNSTSVADTGR